MTAFAHQKSDRVDVFLKPRGREFVQVWNVPRHSPGRHLLLTYFRSAGVPSEVCHHLRFDEGPFTLVEVSDQRRVFYYRDGGGSRLEQFLPSGRLLVSDPRHGFNLRSVFTADFDWERRLPQGKPLKDRPVMRRQSEGTPW